VIEDTENLPPFGGDDLADRCVRQLFREENEEGRRRFDPTWAKEAHGWKQWKRL
jgi:hypothetical protein